MNSFNFNSVQHVLHISGITRRSAAASVGCSGDTLAEVAAGELQTTSSNGLLTHSSAEVRWHTEAADMAAAASLARLQLHLPACSSS
ncbi:unnamed protein product [Closterium sp. Naga37s-1]|nr:unnamed protein product [Closterium sp. Naga37s-1]